jgi:hypothetical protein
MTQVRCARVSTCVLSERACATRFVLASHLTRRITAHGFVTWEPRPLARYAVCNGCEHGYERAMRLRIDPAVPDRLMLPDETRRMESAADWGTVQHQLRHAHRDRGAELADEPSDITVPVDASPERLLAALEHRDRWRSIVRGIVERSEAFGAEHSPDVAAAEREDYAASIRLDGASGVGRCGGAAGLVRSRKGRAKRLRALTAIVAAATVGAGELWRRRRARIADRDVYDADPRRSERGRALALARELGYPVARADGRAYPAPRPSQPASPPA